MKIENQFQKSNIPIIPQKFNEKEHKLILKYTTTMNNNYKYTYELLNTLCINSKSKNKTSLFHKSLQCLLRLLYNLNNNENIIEFDLLVLCSFYLGLKLNELRTKIPKIRKLKEIYPKKYQNYDPLKIKCAELLCIKLLDYNIDILTSYDCLLYLLYNNNNSNNDNNKIFSLALKELENIIKNNIGEYIVMAPMEMAERCILKAQNISQSGYMHPSVLIKEYSNNKNNEQLKKVNTYDNNYNINSYVKKVSCTIKRLRHPALFSCQKYDSNSRNNSNNNDNYNNESNSKYNKKHTNSIYNCSFKILRKLSDVNKTSFSSNITSFNDFKNSMNLNVNTCTIGKKIYEKNITNIISTTKKSSALFKSAILSNSNKNKEEKENSNTNLLLNKNKDINCLGYHNRVIMIGQKKLFD